MEPKKMEQRECPHCKQSFETKEPDRVYCSKLCKQKAYYVRFVAKKPPKPVLPKRDCAFCMGEFQPTKPNKLYCSTLCRNKASAEKRCCGPDSDPNYWSVTTPYGSHGFDFWVTASMQRGATCSTF